MMKKMRIGHAYNIDFLNVVFAASSLFLFAAFTCMVWADYDRDWKTTQRRFEQLQYTVTQKQLNAAVQAVDRTKLQRLEVQQKAARHAVDANQGKVAELEALLRDVDARFYRAAQDYQYAKATYSQDLYEFEALRAAGSSIAAGKQARVAEEAARVNDLNLVVEKVTAERATLQKQLGDITGELAAVTRQMADLTAEQSRLATRLDAVAPSFIKDYVRNAPLFDFMAPTLKIQQVILPNVVDDVNFVRVPKMDRCQTCHLAIDKKGYEKYPQPFATHSNLALYLGGSSPHPLDRVGCTVCHEGMGLSVSFRDAAHTPANRAQQEEWEKKYSWEQPHLWDYPMLERSMTEASCAKCHKQQVYVPNAPKLNVAYATYERAGCYSCHNSKGFDTDIRKPGPILTKIDSKLTPEWVKTWIRNPRAVKRATWMPRLWYNSNNSSPEDAARNEVEINATVSYLFANSEKHEFAFGNPPRGDAKRGEALVTSIGCLGCHVVGDHKRSEISTRRTFGQPLENIGNKTTYEWLYNWVKDPTHYSPMTYMPNLRLSDEQVADVATYLSGLKGPAGDPPKAEPDQKAVDAVILDYYRSVMPFDEARAAIGKLSTEQKQIELGKRVIARYGCFNCHDIKGFENAQPIGTDLSEEGSKLVSRLDFAFITDIPHTSKTAWFRAKLRDPRIFDKGRVLSPLDKLRMPNYDFTGEEVDRLLTAILSFQREIQPAAALPARSARYDYLTKGRTLVHRRNCVGCHVIEGDGGDFVKLVAEPNLGPPMLTPEGARVRPDWLYAFLRAPITVRPWLAVRMPTYGLGDPALNGVIRYFGAVSGAGLPFQALAISHNDTAGRQVFELLKCQQCHVLGAIPKDQPAANLAPDLRLAAERLQPDWILDWLKKPSGILPGTRMPAYWPDYPRSPYPQLGANADAQIVAVRNHLLTLGGGRAPGAARMFHGRRIPQTADVGDARAMKSSAAP